MDPEKKELLRKSILGHPDLLAVEISDKTYSRVHGRKMSYNQYMEHVMEICQSVDISCQETAPSQKRLAENHEQDDKATASTSYQAKVHETEEDDQEHEESNDDSEDNLEINKLVQKKPATKT